MAIARHLGWHGANVFAIRTAHRRRARSGADLLPGSSVVEQPAVNRLVAGSNPARGAIFFPSPYADKLAAGQSCFRPVPLTSGVPLKSVFDIGLVEVLADEKQRTTSSLCRLVSKTITQIETCGVNTLAPSTIALRYAFGCLFGYVENFEP